MSLALLPWGVSREGAISSFSTRECLLIQTWAINDFSQMTRVLYTHEVSMDNSLPTITISYSHYLCFL